MFGLLSEDCLQTNKALKFCFTLSHASCWKRCGHGVLCFDWNGVTDPSTEGEEERGCVRLWDIFMCSASTAN